MHSTFVCLRNLHRINYSHIEYDANDDTQIFSERVTCNIYYTRKMKMKMNIHMFRIDGSGRSVILSKILSCFIFIRLISLSSKLNYENEIRHVKSKIYMYFFFSFYSLYYSISRVLIEFLESSLVVTET